MEGNSPILFVHQKKHVGGGQTYVNGLISGFFQNGFKAKLIEDKTPLKIVGEIFHSKSKYVIWSIYDEFPIFPYVISYILGKKNLLVIYGIWMLESRSLYVNNGDFEEGYAQRLHEIKLLLRQFIFILFSSDIIHLSEYAKSLFYSIVAFRIFKYKKNIIIYGGVDRRTFKQISPKNKLTLRNQLGIGRYDTILLMVGRMERRKNFENALLILKELKKVMPNENIFLYLVISYGEFNDLRYLKTLLKKIGELNLGEYVRIISGIPHERVSTLYQASDIYLMLSEELETFGLVTAEALSCGLPVFGYDTCATSEIVSKSKVKFLFKPESVKLLSRAVANFLKAPVTQRKVMVKGQSNSLSRFTWPKVAASIIKELT